MYTLAVQRDFVAQHRLIGGDWGPENEWHSHHYRLELQIEGKELDRHGYLVDIEKVEAALEDLVAAYRDKTLNELDEFVGLNPSLEHFCRIACHRLAAAIGTSGLRAYTVRLWESDTAWAAYRLKIED